MAEIEDVPRSTAGACEDVRASRSTTLQDAVSAPGRDSPGRPVGDERPALVEREAPVEPITSPPASASSPRRWVAPVPKWIVGAFTASGSARSTARPASGREAARACRPTSRRAG